MTLAVGDCNTVPEDEVVVDSELDADWDEESVADSESELDEVAEAVDDPLPESLAVCVLLVVAVILRLPVVVPVSDAEADDVYELVTETVDVREYVADSEVEDVTLRPELEEKEGVREKDGVRVDVNEAESDNEPLLVTVAVADADGLPVVVPLPETDPDALTDMEGEALLVKVCEADTDPEAEVVVLALNVPLPVGDTLLDAVSLLDTVLVLELLGDEDEEVLEVGDVLPDAEPLHELVPLADKDTLGETEAVGEKLGVPVTLAPSVPEEDAEGEYDAVTVVVTVPVDVNVALGLGPAVADALTVEDSVIEVLPLPLLEIVPDVDTLTVRVPLGEVVTEIDGDGETEDVCDADELTVVLTVTLGLTLTEGDPLPVALTVTEALTLALAVRVGDTVAVEVEDTEELAVALTDTLGVVLTDELEVEEAVTL